MWRTVQWAEFRVDIDLQLCHFAAQTSTLCAFKDISRLFFRVCLLPQEKKTKTTLYLSSVKSHFFSSPRGSQTEPRHAFTMKGKSPISKPRATSRRIKAQITATILGGGEWLPALDTRPPPVVLTPYNSGQQDTQVYLRPRCWTDMYIIIQIMTRKLKTGKLKGFLSFKCEHGLRLHVKMDIHFYI